MGYIRHDAIIVTSWNGIHVERSRQKAIEFGLACSEIVDSPVNGYHSFLIAPDGSKEGWPDSNAGDDARDMWREWARGNDWIDWVHVSYGGDEPELAHVVNRNCSEYGSGQ